MADDSVGSARPGEGPADLAEARARSLERFPVRTRDSAVTQSGWRLVADGAKGEGAIVLVEISARETFFRGEGIFLGWPQERLEAAYRALLPRAEGPTFELNQLG